MDDQESPNPDEQIDTPHEESDLQIDEEILTESDDSEVIALAEQNAALLSDLQRIQADFDNFRRQNAKR